MPSSDVISAQQSESKISNSKFPFKPLIIEICFVFFRFLGFYFCAKAILGDIDMNLNSLLSSFSFAWTVGMVLPGAPGGTGVFESLLLLTLGTSIAKADLLVILLFYRTISTFSDLIIPLPILLRNKFFNPIIK